MTPSRLLVIAAAAVTALTASSAFAGPQHRGGGRVVVGHAVPRTGFGPRFIHPRVVSVIPYRPYYYRPRFTFGFAFGYPYYYGYPYGYAYPYYYPAYGYGAYGYGYGYPLPPAGYYAPMAGRAYGGVRIEGAPPDAEIFADGYYVGVADDFDGAFQHLNLEAGPHRIEIRPRGLEAIAFDVNIQPGRTVTYHADVRPIR